MMRPLVLVSCTKNKARRAAPARELYRSRVFAESLRVAELSGVPLILSARYGAIAPDRAIEPYDVTIADMHPTDLRIWRLVLEVQLVDAAGGAPSSIVVLAGERYASEVARLCSLRDWAPPVLPLEGLASGPRYRWLRSERERLELELRGAA